MSLYLIITYKIIDYMIDEEFGLLRLWYSMKGSKKIQYLEKSLKGEEWKNKN